MNRIILYRPIITEKSMKLAAQGLYTFEVDKKAKKPQITKAVEGQFKVDVVKVKTANTKSEVKMQRRVRRYYQTPGLKKAYVVLKKGQKITLFEAAKKGEEEVAVQRAEEGPSLVKEKKDILKRTKVKVEKGAPGVAPTTQRKVIPT